MKILVIVDMQYDFIDGALGTAEAQAIVPNVIDKIRKYEDKNNTLILFTKDTHYENYINTLEGEMLPVPHCIKGTKGCCIHRDVIEAADMKQYLTLETDRRVATFINKYTFGSEELVNMLKREERSIEQVEFCGLCTDICVVSNVLMARAALPNTKIIVDSSCCAGVTPEKHEAALEVMRSCQIEVI